MTTALLAGSACALLTAVNLASLGVAAARRGGRGAWNRCGRPERGFLLLASLLACRALASHAAVLRHSDGGLRTRSVRLPRRGHRSRGR